MDRKLQENQTVRVRDAENAIFHPNNVVEEENIVSAEKHLGSAPDREVTVYTVFGKHDYLDGHDFPILGDESDNVLAEDRDLAFAKEVSVDGRNSHYYIRRASNGRLFNPNGMDEGRHNKFLHHSGKREFEYHQVNQRVFNFYKDFLKSKNPAHLRNAEREAF